MKNNINIYCLLIAIICLTSCKKLAIIKAPGNVEQETFTTTFPFELRRGVIVMDVNLKGKIYEFVLDTGGFNLLDEKVAAAVGIEGKKTIDIGDSQGNSKKTPILKLDEIEIAGINFQETGTGIVDFKDLNAISCLELQGMIGANLMQNAVWQIDYQQKEITISHSMGAFDIPANSHTIPFTTGTLKSPDIEVVVDGFIEKEVEIDLGSTGGFKLSKATFEKLTTDQKASGTGLYAAGLYGYGEPETTNFAMVKQLSLGNLQLTDQLVDFKSSGTSTIGNKFLQNYRVILNWFDKELILIPVIELPTTPLENYGFKPIYNEGQPQIGFIYDNFSADKKGLKITDQIIELNGQNAKDISKEEWCSLLDMLNQTTDKTIQIEIIRGTETLNFELTRIQLF